MIISKYQFTFIICRSDSGSSNLEASYNSWKKEDRGLELEKAAREGTLEVDIQEVKDIWLNSGDAYKAIFKSAELYGIYEDLFR